MIFPDFQEFIQLAQQGNFVPVYQEWVADLDTPVSAWYKVCAGQPYSFLLESVEGGEKVGRYSLLGCDPLWILEARGNQTTQIYRDGRRQVFQGDPFRVLADCLAPYHPVKLPELPSGIGGLFGFWGYELINWIEPTVPIHSQDDRYIPDGLWMQVDHLLIFDQVKRKIWAIAYADLRQPDVDLRQAYQQACDTVESLLAKLQQPLSPQDTALSWVSPDRLSQGEATLPYTSNTSQAAFCQNVDRAKAYIQAGDIFQVVISQRLTTPYSGDPFGLYRSLRLINPSPYMAYFQFNGWQIIGSSPEVMVKAERSPQYPDQMVATLRPIAGTRRRERNCRARHVD